MEGGDERGLADQPGLEREQAEQEAAGGVGGLRGHGGAAPGAARTWVGGNSGTFGSPKVNQYARPCHIAGRAISSTACCSTGPCAD